MTIKEAVLNRLEKLKINHPSEFEDVDIDSVELYLNVTTEPELILEIIGNNKNKFKLIIRTILLGEYNDLLYKKEDDDVYAMRFSNPNSRIYCREIHGKKKIIIMSRGFFNKTSQKNNKTNQPIIDSIKKETYKFYEKYEETDRYKNHSQ